MSKVNIKIPTRITGSPPPIVQNQKFSINHALLRTKLDPPHCVIEISRYTCLQPLIMHLNCLFVWILRNSVSLIHLRLQEALPKITRYEAIQKPGRGILSKSLQSLLSIILFIREKSPQKYRVYTLIINVVQIWRIEDRLNILTT